MSRKPTKTRSLDDLPSYKQERKELDNKREAQISQMLQSSTGDRKPANNAEMHTPIPIRPLSPALKELLNIPRPGESKQTKKHDGVGLPPPPVSIKTPTFVEKKQIEEITPKIINARNLPRALHPSVHTLMSLNPRARRRTTKFTKKSKAGKNKTQKRKTKKTKKNKKTKK